MQYLFGDYALDPDRRELTRQAEAVAIGPKVFDLLLYLIQNREHVVSKDDLLEAVWSGRIVSESTLTSHINAVRKAVGDSGEEQRLVRTITRKGFRFVGEVKEASDDRASSDTSIAKSEEASAPALILPDSPSIAALPFQNWSGDSEQEYFADGVVEDIITALVAHSLAVRHRAQLKLHLQGPRRRREAGRSRAWRALRARRQRPQGSATGSASPAS